MTTIFVLTVSILFYEQNMNESYNQIMNHKFSLNFPWDFQIFWLFKFSKFLPNYPGFPRVLWTLLSRPLSQLVVQNQD